VIKTYVIKRGHVYFKEWVFRGNIKPPLRRWSNVSPMKFYADDHDEAELTRLRTMATNLGGNLAQLVLF
jgi:hypothetical protein